MKKQKPLLLILFVFFTVFANAQQKPTDTLLNTKAHQWIKSNSSLRFIENKGQLADLQNRPVSNLLYKTSVGGVDMYITTNGLSYVFTKLEKHKKTRQGAIHSKFNIYDSITGQYCRADMELEGADIRRGNVIKEGESKEITDYYLGGICPDGVLNVHSYTKVTVKNIYPGIDWVLYSSSKGLKYDFVVHPGADASLIKLKYKWTDKPEMQNDGSLKINTPMGSVNEGSPTSYLERGKNKIKTNYIIHKDEISFNISEYNSNETLIIDPVLEWATYYGGNSIDDIYSVQDDGTNVWVCGTTNSSNFPTQNPGSGVYFQGTLGGNCYNAVLLKFNLAGVLLWSTYYGGNDYDWGISMYSDGVNVWVTGATASKNFPTLNPGGGAYFQGTNKDTSADRSAFILQFSTSGIRKWATYYGGSGVYNDDGEWGFSIQSDGVNVWVTGFTESADFPTFNPGGGAYFQGTDGGGARITNLFILQFNTSGVRKWGTYYGGSNGDKGASIYSDGVNVWVTGNTSSTDFPTLNPGGGAYFQGTLGQKYTSTACILEFNTSGVRKWATYYGGSNGDYGSSIQSDGNDVWLTGSTGSSNFPTLDPGGGAYFQSTLGSIENVFISQFGTNGIRKWSTYYGGNGGQGDQGFSIQSDRTNVWVCGATSSGNLHTLTSGGCGSFNQDTIGNITTPDDVFILQFNTKGVLKWSTYYGVDNENDGSYISSDGTNLFVAGDADRRGYPILNNGGGAYNQTTLLGEENGFIGKFCIACTSISVSVSSSVAICAGNTTSLFASGTNSYSWNPPTGLSSTSIANPVASPTVTTTYTVTGTSGSCVSNDTVTVEVFPKPIPGISGIQPICEGSSVTLNASGGMIYNWSPSVGLSSDVISNPIASPLSSTTYTVIVANPGCSSKDSITLNVNPAPAVIACCNTTMNIGKSTSLNVSPIINSNTYNWVPSEGLSCNTCPNPIVSPQYTTWYYVTITDSLGCSKTDTVLVDILCGNLFIPNAFSPNGDGQNDRLYVRDECIKSLDFKVFDRWDNVVFETTDKNNGWDGTFKGQPMNTGTYVYYLSATMYDGTTTERKGNVALVR